MFLETLTGHLERLGDALFRAGLGFFLLATGADGAIHLTGWHQFEAAAHLGIFAGMALSSLALVVRGSAPIRKERPHASR